MSTIYNWEVIFDKVRFLVEKNPNISKAEIAYTLGIPVSTLKDAFKREWMIEEVSEILTTNKYNGRYRDKHIQVEGSCINIGDLEIPYQNDFLIRKVVMIGRLFGIKTLNIVGDFLCVDSVTHWPRGAGEQRVSLKEELAEAKRVLAILGEWFEEMNFVLGNHEARLTKATGGQMDMDLIFSIIVPETVKVTVSNFNYMEVEGDWLLTHAKEYSRNPRAVALRMAQTYLKNIISFHQHHQSSSYDPSGKFKLVDNGCLTDASLRHYKYVDISSLPAWNYGFSVLRKDEKGEMKLHMFNSDSDWSFWDTLAGN